MALCVSSEGSRGEETELSADFNIGLLGCGTVGAAVATRLIDERTALEASAGAPLELKRVAVRHVDKKRPVDLSQVGVGDDALAVVIDPSIDIVVELIGGIEPARTLILTALREGKSVVTANKELLAHHGSELLAAAELKGTDLYFEASVGGAVPVVRALRESLSGDRVTKIQGVLNGTANFVLTRMEEDGCSLADALEEAQQRGFAEADPSADIEGFDAAAKAAILATLISRQPVTPAEVEVEGIADVTRDEIRSAARRGFAVKLVTSIDLHSRGLSARVGPALVPREHPLSGARYETNAVVIDAEAAGRLVFVGAGAGGPATASAVLGDIVAVARNALWRARGPALCMS